MVSTIVVNIANGVAHIQLNRPEKRNALTQDMYRRLAEELFSVDQSAHIRVVVLSGEDGCFCAGNDLNDFIGMDSEVAWHGSPVYQFMVALSELTKPVIAGVEGSAVGIGATMLLHCDCVFADTNAQFQFPFVNLGVCPEFGASLLLPQFVGKRVASDWLMTGRVIGAHEALQAGFITNVTSEPIARALAWASSLSEQPVQALSRTKRLLQDVGREQLRNVIDAEAEVFLKALQGEEFKAAFNEREK